VHSNLLYLPSIVFSIYTQHSTWRTLSAHIASCVAMVQIAALLPEADFSNCWTLQLRLAA
jgi:hypothetical protein